MRQCESVFLFPRPQSAHFGARIFKIQEELAFAGHPLLGAASVMHFLDASGTTRRRWIIELSTASLVTATEDKGTHYHAIIHQRAPILENAPLRQKGKS
jgi:predicted PhzF superfamily epimerase YddE/YHI9